MIFHYYLDKYLSFRSGIILYYFGDGYIADYYSNSIAYIKPQDAVRLKYINGEKTVRQTILTIEKELSDDSDIITEIIKNYMKKGVLVCSDNPIVYQPIVYGTHGKYYPKEVAIELTNRCNYHCPFCYRNADNNGIYMTDEIFNNIYNDINGNVHNILLTGGEPTLHFNINKYITLLSKNSNVSMITNGSILYKMPVDVISKLSNVQVSIYGCNKKEYQKMTGVEDGYNYLCKSAKYLKDNSISCMASVTFSIETLDHIIDFINTAIDLGFDKLRIGMADSFGRGKYLLNNNDYIKKYMDGYDTLREAKRKYSKQISIELSNINSSHVESHDDIKESVIRGSLSCGCGSEYLVISPTGKIRPCQMLPEEWFGNEKNITLKNYIDGDFQIDTLRNNIIRFYKDNGFDKINYSPCEALEIKSKEWMKVEDGVLYVK